MTTPNGAAEPSLASAGSRGEPFAWAAECAPGAWSFTHMSHVASRWPQSETIPLYREPQPTLTDEEREALRKVLRRVREDYFAGRFADSVEVAAVIDGLLERTK